MNSKGMHTSIPIWLLRTRTNEIQYFKHIDMRKQNILLRAAAVFMAGLMLFSCDKTQKVTELQLSEKTASFETGAGDKTISVTCNADWTVTCTADWITVDPKSGSGNGSFKISVPANESFEVRSADITVTAGDKTQTVKVNQLSLSPSLLLDKEALDAEAEGGAFDVTVTSNAAWTVTIPADAAWVTADKASGTGNGTVKFTVAANETFDARDAEVTFTYEGQKKTVKVHQAALTAFLNLNPETVSAPAEGVVAEVEVDANVAWTVAIPEGCDWITADKTSGTGKDKVAFTIAENNALKGRTATVVFNGEQDQKKEVAVSQLQAAPSRQTDSLALVAIFNATGGAENWHAERVWKLNKPIDEWYSIKLNEEGRVIQVNLAKSTVTAPWTLPAEIGDLTELTIFKIIGCQLTGAIPEEIYNLTKLVSLYLTNNTPTWTLSPKIAGMTELKDLYIDQNPNLTGELPKELGQLKKLVNINVAQTGISGEIPAEMSGCSSLNNLMAYKTQLTGIPDNFDEWPALKLIQLYSIPGLTGSLPASVGRCTKVTSVWFYDCNFTGNIPESWGTLPASCGQLRIQDNKLSGVVPAVIRNHSKWGAWNAAKYILPQQEGYGLTTE